MPALLILLAFTLAGCGVVEQAVNAPRSVVVPLEVWNRTLDPVFLIDQDGRRLDVPACGHALAAEFHVNKVEVRTEEGLYFGSGTSGAGDTGRPQRMVITATPGDDPALNGQENPRLPPCEGHPEVEHAGR